MIKSQSITFLASALGTLSHRFKSCRPDSIKSKSHSKVSKLSFLLGKDKKNLFWVFLLYSVASSLEMIGIGLLAPFLTLIFTPTSFDVSDANSGLFSIVERSWHYIGNSRLSIDILALVIISVFGLKFLITVLSSYVVTNFSQKQRTKIGKRLLTIFLSMDFLEYQKRTEADGLYEIQTVSAVFFQCLQVLMKSLSEILTLIVLITPMFFLQPLLSLIELHTKEQKLL